MKIKLTILFLLLSVILDNQTLLAKEISTTSAEVVALKEVKWEQLNPARGDKSPQAGTLWGDRKGEVPTGFLVKFVDGFSSPPHIHNVTYRGVVINGLIHNDDPDAKKMWMPEGSFWTQPKGEVHITAAKGNQNIAFIEIDHGPYLVLHEEEAFDSGERPINIDANNVVWVEMPNKFDAKKGTKIAYLWGDLTKNKLRGTMVKLSANFSGEIQSNASIFRAVLIQGQLQIGKDELNILEPGSYFGSNTNHNHEIKSASEEEVIIYIRSNDNFKIK